MYMDTVDQLNLAIYQSDEGKPKQKFVAAFGTIFISVFKEATETSFIFLLKKAG